MPAPTRPVAPPQALRSNPGTFSVNAELWIQYQASTLPTWIEAASEFIEEQTEIALATSAAGELPPLTDQAGKFLRVAENETGLVFASPTPPTQTILTTGVAQTYTPPTGCKAILVEMCGGGGGGKGASGQSFYNGGAGGSLRKLISSPASSYTYTVGAAGAGAAISGVSGSAGGATSFSGGGVTLTANGGDGGNSLATTGEGGTASGGDINVRGQSALNSPATDDIPSPAPGSIFGPSDSRYSGAGTALAATDAGVPGAGGLGGYNDAENNFSGLGGDGGPGIIIITEFY